MYNRGAVTSNSKLLNLKDLIFTLSLLLTHKQNLA